jgi:hypothetical protein
MLQGGVFEEVLGERFTSSLAKNKVAGVEGVRIHLETERVRSAAGNAVVFAPFVSEKLLTKLIADNRTKELVYIPWAEPERDAYLKRHPASTPLSAHV